MKRQLAWLLAIGLSSAAFAGTVTAATPAATHFFQNVQKQAFASWNNAGIGTSLHLVQNVGSNVDAPAELFLSQSPNCFFGFDCPNPFVSTDVFLTTGFKGSIAADLSSAHVEGAFPAQTCSTDLNTFKRVCTPPTTVQVNLTWKATGPATARVGTLFCPAPGFKPGPGSTSFGIFHANGRSRPAGLGIPFLLEGLPSPLGTLQDVGLSRVNFGATGLNGNPGFCFDGITRPTP